MTALTIDGCPFDPLLAEWRVRTPTTKVLFDFRLPSASAGMIADLRGAIAYLLVRRTPEQVHGFLSRCRVLARHAAACRGGPIRAFDLRDFEEFRRSLDVRQLYLAAHMLTALKHLDAAGFAGIAEDLRRELPTMRVSYPRLTSPARTACRRSGPLSPTEMAAVTAALEKAWAEGRLAVADFALCMLALALRPRPGQAALLKVGDLFPPASGRSAGMLRMPVIKIRRRGAPAPRADVRCLHPDVADALAAQCRVAVAWGGARGIAPADCPMFPPDPEAGRRDDGPELPWIVGHSTAGAIARRITRTFASLDLSAVRKRPDERRILATRLRRSLATSARSAGCTFEQIGHLLGHSGRATAAVYTGPSVGVIERVERAVDFRPLAQLYRRELEAAAQEGNKS